MSQDWFCYIGGEVVGPFDGRAVQTMAERGRLKPDDRVRRGGDGPWVAASGIKGLTFKPRGMNCPEAPATVADAEGEPLPPSGRAEGQDVSSQYAYKMVQVPPTIEVQEGTSTKGKAAAYLEEIVNAYGKQGWEFYRVDEIGIRVMPGCLMTLLGQQPRTRIFYVVTFRRPA